MSSWKLPIMLFLASFVLCLTSCNKELSYEEWIASEADKGVLLTDIFLDMYFEMPSEDFFDKCRELNRQQLITQGPGGLSVKYEPEELDHPGNMLFYPAFLEGKIAFMPVIFEYKAWAPWNKDQHSDKLLLDVLDMFENWYGAGFRIMEHPKYGKAYIKVEGNREVAVAIKDDRQVTAWITDLRQREALDRMEEGEAAAE